MGELPLVADVEVLLTRCWGTASPSSGSSASTAEIARSPRSTASVRCREDAPREGDPSIEIELNPRERRLYDRVRAQRRRGGAGRGSGLRDLLLLIPDFVVLLSRLLRDQRVAPATRRVALVGIAYVLSPIDLMPVSSSVRSARSTTCSSWPPRSRAS